MSRAFRDPPFVRVVDEAIMGNWSDERIIFIDLDNQIREVVYASEFGNGELERIRDRLENNQILKGIVHVSAATLGDRNREGPRYSTVEYLPNKETYVRSHIVSMPHWITQHEVWQVAVDATQATFGRDNGEETEDEPDE